MSNYIDLTSLMNKPYWKKVEYEVPDRWHDSSLQCSFRRIYVDDKVCSTQWIYHDDWWGCSELGFNPWNQVAVVPSYDIPSNTLTRVLGCFVF